MVDDGLTLIDVPVPAEVPPQLTVNQSTVSPAFTVAEIVEDAPLQIVLGEAEGLVGVAGSGLTVTVTWAHAVLTQPVTFDWNDVTAAASYQIQIDDASTFTAPVVVDQTVTPSQFTTGGFANVLHSWRVRGINSAGTAGPWSAVRRFTPQSAPAAAALSALSLNPTSVIGGTSSQGTVTLTAAAPAGGFGVTLSSNNAAVTVPPSVTVAAGATTATFTVSTTSVTASSVATITATAGTVARTAALTVTPPGQTATLSVTATGRNGERVTSSPAGINVPVGSAGSASFSTGTAITLSVTNDLDAIWSGACSSGGNKTKSCTLTLTGAASVTANVQ